MINPANVLTISIIRLCCAIMRQFCDIFLTAPQRFRKPRFLGGLLMNTKTPAIPHGNANGASVPSEP